jgi:CRISPR-associated protein Cas1
MKAQLAMGRPQRKQLWQGLVRRKIHNQGAVISHFGDSGLGKRLAGLAEEVKSGDSENLEAQASQLYFPALFGIGFSRKQERLHNAALNYGYTVIRSALARSLVSYGFNTAFGLHHHSEQNSFNLADDLIEPFRPLLDAYLLQNFPEEDTEGLTPTHKATLVNVLHQDIPMVDSEGLISRSNLLASTEAVVISLSQRLGDGSHQLHLPTFKPD